MADRRPIAPGDSVVVVDIAGQLMRDHRERVMRGTVLSVGFFRFFGTAVVSLARSGRQVAVGVQRLRRCPELAYVRGTTVDAPTHPGAA